MSYVIYIIIIFFNICASNANIIQETVHPMDHSMNETGTRIDQHQMLDFTLDKKYTLQNTLELINGHLEQFNSLYITRLDQKLLSLVTYVSSMDSNIKNIQERAHIWDTFQLHVSAWNDQIKTLDRKVDIINSGQERMALLENRLGVLLNLEYNAQRALNKLSSMEDRMDKVELALMRLADLHGREESRLEHQLAGRGLLVSLKQMEMKIDRNFALMRKPGNSKIRFFDKRNSNQTLVGRKLLIKCSTPPALEELIKDTASKVDLIFDKLSVDGTSDEEAKKHEPADDLEDIEHDYSVEMYQNDPGEDLVKTAQKKPNY